MELSEKQRIMSNEMDQWERLRQSLGAIPFNFECSTDVFANDEFLLLRKWGVVFQALATGTVLPVNLSQQRFVDETAGKSQPTFEGSRCWLKYLARCDAESLRKETPRFVQHEEGEEWYSRSTATEGIHFPRRDAFFNKVQHN